MIRRHTEARHWHWVIYPEENRREPAYSERWLVNLATRAPSNPRWPRVFYLRSLSGVYYTCTSTAAVDNPLRTITPNTESVVHSVVARGHHSGVIYCMWPCLWRDSRIKVLLTYFTVTTSVIIVIDIKHAQNKRCYKSFTFLSGPVGETDKFQWLRHKHSDQLRHWGSERP